MSFKNKSKDKQENRPKLLLSKMKGSPRSVDDYKEGDIEIMCSCFKFSNTEKLHPTDTIDSETCSYCGFYYIETRLSPKLVRRFNGKGYREMLMEEKKKRKLFLDKERLHGVKLH